MEPAKLLTTEALAERLGVKPQSLRGALCRTGSYYGLRPQKMLNRLLLWPADAVERLAAGTAGRKVEG